MSAVTGLDIRRAVAVVALLGGVLVMAEQARGAYPGDNGRIAF